MDAITSLGNFFSGPAGKLLQAGTAVTGETGNILNMIQRGQQFDKLKSFENLSPQQLSAKVAAGTQPLNAGLVQSVTNSVQGADAERGLATSPGIFNADLAQSLAPYQQQNQNTALQLLMKQIGLPTEASSILNPVSSMGGSFAQLMKQFQPPTGAGAVTLPPNLMDLMYGTPASASGLTDSPVDYGSTQTANG
jgi:hypothetical protein